MSEARIARTKGYTNARVIRSLDDFRAELASGESPRPTIVVFPGSGEPVAFYGGKPRDVARAIRFELSRQ
jgi:hypothetical protein